MTEKTRVGTIDLTPTWTGILPIMFYSMEYGKDANKDLVKAEFVWMAALADKYVAIQKAKGQTE